VKELNYSCYALFVNQGQFFWLKGFWRISSDCLALSAVDK